MVERLHAFFRSLSLSLSFWDQASQVLCDSASWPAFLGSTAKLQSQVYCSPGVTKGEVIDPMTISKVWEKKNIVAH